MKDGQRERPQWMIRWDKGELELKRAIGREGRSVGFYLPRDYVWL